MDLAVVGDTTVVDSFRLVGIEGVVPESADQAAREVRRLVDEGAAVLIGQAWAAAIKDDLERLRAEKRHALVLEIPDLKGAPSQAQDMQQLIEQAIGMKL